MSLKRLLFEKTETAFARVTLITSRKAALEAHKAQLDTAYAGVRAAATEALRFGCDFQAAIVEPIATFVGTVGRDFGRKSMGRLLRRLRALRVVHERRDPTRLPLLCDALFDELLRACHARVTAKLVADISHWRHWLFTVVAESKKSPWVEGDDDDDGSIANADNNYDYNNVFIFEPDDSDDDAFIFYGIYDCKHANLKAGCRRCDDFHFFGGIHDAKLGAAVEGFFAFSTTKRDAVRQLLAKPTRVIGAAADFADANLNRFPLRVSTFGPSSTSDTNSHSDSDDDFFCDSDSESDSDSYD